MHAANPHTPDGDTDALLTALATDPHTSLASLAARHNTTVAALTLWTTRPDIAARLATFDTLLAHRVRLIASGTLPAAIATLSTITDEFVASTRASATTHTASHRSTHTASSDAPRAAPSTAAPPASDSSTPHLLRLRAAETARRAASTLIRLANFAPGPRRTPRPLALGAAPLPNPPAARAPTNTHARSAPTPSTSARHAPASNTPPNDTTQQRAANPTALLTLLAALAQTDTTQPCKTTTPTNETPQPGPTPQTSASNHHPPTPPPAAQAHGCQTPPQVNPTASTTAHPPTPRERPPPGAQSPPQKL